MLTLTALASFEAVTALPAAAGKLGQARVSARRIAAALDAPDPVSEPLTPRPLPGGPISVRLLDWIESLPLRWDTPVGSHGAALSGGQRQRLAVARALLADPDLLILDEPTAHLDPGTRRALLSDLLAAIAGHTMLLITHDLDGLDELDELDQVITLEGGKIAERGSR